MQNCWSCFNWCENLRNLPKVNRFSALKIDPQALWKTEKSQFKFSLEVHSTTFLWAYAMHNVSYYSRSLIIETIKDFEIIKPVLSTKLTTANCVKEIGTPSWRWTFRKLVQRTGYLLVLMNAAPLGLIDRWLVFYYHLTYLCCHY